MFVQDEYDALQTGAGLLDRRGRGRLELTGADRRAYLHGLLSNDILVLSAGDGCYATLLTPQGRMISDMRVSELGDRVLIDLPASAAGAVRQRLADFIFSEDVAVADAGSSLAHLGLYGPQAAAILARVLTRAVDPDTPEAGQAQLDAMRLDGNASWRFDGEPIVVIRSDDYGIPGFELFGAPSPVARLSDAVLSAGAVTLSPAAADMTRVEAGRPEFGVDMDEHTIPLEAGIEQRAISLTKGCYVGQEIIIRVLHRGQGRVARRLVGFVGDPSRPMARGEHLYANGKNVGTVTSAVSSPRLRRPVGLGYVHRDEAEAGRVLTIGEGDAAGSATIVTLPFTPPAAG